jgi:hypothetical protein
MSILEPENATFKTVFLINIIVYNPVKPSTKKKKSAIASTAEDYINFLRAVLAIHGKTEYKVTLKKPYSFKYIYDSTQ